MRNLLTFGTLALLFGNAALEAHEFIIKPVDTPATVDKALPFTVESTHVFIQPEEMEAADTVTVALLQDGQPTTLALTENPALKQLQGEVKLTKESGAYLVGHRHGQVWSKTPSGWQAGGRDAHPDSLQTNRFEKFAKTWLNAQKAGDAFKQPVGQLLEIVPLTNPAALKVGEDLPVQVLYRGEPLATEIYATFDGFTDTPGSYAYFTETYGEGSASGLAKVRVWAPGLWIVRVEHRAAGETADIQEHVMRAVLAFSVQ